MSECGRSVGRVDHHRRLLAALAASMLVLLAGCGREPERHRETLHVFGSTAQLDLVDAAPERRTPVLAAIAAELNRLHRDWHPWEPGALTELNAALARGERVPLPASIDELIKHSRPIAMRSDGLFNPAIGRLIAMWGYHTSDYPVRTPAPDDEALQTWRRRVPTLFDLVHDGEQVFSRHPALQLDFAAIAEGAAARRVVALLRAAGLSNALLTLGGDVVALGDAGGRPWRVGLRDPFGEAGSAFASVDLHDGEALFSSGNYARYRTAPDGTRWPHVLDPRSGLPVRGVAAVSVLHHDPLLADAAATALMVGGPARFAELSNRLGIQCALLLTERDELIITTAMQQRLTLQRPVAMLGPPLGIAAPCHRPGSR